MENLGKSSSREEVPYSKRKRIDKTRAHCASFWIWVCTVPFHKIAKTLILYFLRMSRYQILQSKSSISSTVPPRKFVHFKILQTYYVQITHIPNEMRQFFWVSPEIQNVDKRLFASPKGSLLIAILSHIFAMCSKKNIVGVLACRSFFP